jgi:hypothetical protein
LVKVKIRVEAWPTTDIYPRYHGLGIDQDVREDFWVSQPHKIIKVTASRFTYETVVDLAPAPGGVLYAVGTLTPATFQATLGTPDSMWMISS